MSTLLRLENITKAFPGVLANDCISLAIECGEIHALLGENGAGKTTLMNILSGLYHPDSGHIHFNGTSVRLESPKVAISHGIGMVHQHFMLIPELTVVENIILGLPSHRGPLLDLKSAATKISELSDKLGLGVDPYTHVWKLSPGGRQRVEIVKALYRGAQLLILDEPTAVLTPNEVKDLFRTLRHLASMGHSIIFISHKLNEVMEISDRITVLRQGRVVNTVERAATSPAELARMMVGREVVFRVTRPPLAKGKCALKVEDVHVHGEDGRMAVKGVTFSLHEGEILGIAGVDGNGQVELMQALCGLRSPISGRVFLFDKETTGLSVKDLSRMRVAHIPEDRHHGGLALDFPISENLIMKNFDCDPMSRRGFLNMSTILDNATRLINNFDVRAPGPNVRAALLSGGNQQKVVLARELSQEPNIILAAQPTRGLDIAATEYVYQQLLLQRERKAAILLVSTDLDEVLSLSDRVAVMYAGQFAGIVPNENIDLEELGLMMAGAKVFHGTVGAG